MSVIGSDDVKDQDCERGKVNQRPPISYAQFRYKQWVTKPNQIKIKLPGGNQFSYDLMNGAGNSETYLKWIQVYDCVLCEKKLHEKLNIATESLKKVLEEMKKFLKIPKRETPELKGVWELEVTTTRMKLLELEANGVHRIAIMA